MKKSALDVWGWFGFLALLVIIAGAARDCQVRHVEDGDDSIHLVVTSP